jgi:hypothetical protein
LYRDRFVQRSFQLGKDQFIGLRSGGVAGQEERLAPARGSSRQPPLWLRDIRDDNIARAQGRDQERFDNWLFLGGFALNPADGAKQPSDRSLLA